MDYTILEAHIVYQNDKLYEVIVLWADGSFIRGTYSNLNPKAGYESLTSKSVLSPDLFQRVAAGGSYLDDDRKKKYFPNRKNWSR